MFCLRQITLCFFSYCAITIITIKLHECTYSKNIANTTQKKSLKSHSNNKHA